MEEHRPFYELEQRIGYRFRDASYAQQALTHSSKSGSANNERLEFLGDRVLNLVIAHALFTQYPNENEGSLAKRHASLVQGRLLAAVGREVNLGDHIILSEGERHAGGAKNENIVADAMEAMLGAVFLDGGLESAQGLILRLWDAHILKPAESHQDSKTELQEWVQARALPLPEYEIVGRSGPDHAPIFAVEIRVRGFDPIVCEGASRRVAEKAAAEKMLQLVKEKK
ncbi:MAG: ribonuclease III [Micavibrio aeruginosavorus]|uniref:Ribonuclease 3 n=1 Tax=Micavibrio aeruginosavorus TaxID=349221 RepID=A0A2W5A1P1_9BACT|nr:MAG: ribonuclease III [Micavibrio aeruginosavorus]